MKTHRTSTRLPSALLLLALPLAACGGDDSTDPDATPGADTAPIIDGTSPDAPGAGAIYTFPSRYGAGDSVVYTGQAFRNVLLTDLGNYVGSLTTRLDDGSFAPANGDVERALLFYYAFDATTSADVPLLLATTPAATQLTYGAFGSMTNLAVKIAGAEAVHDHRDWATELGGWGATGSTTPDALVRDWIAELDDRAFARAQGTIPLGPTGEPISKVEVTPQGVDLSEILRKFLTMAVAFDQATDKYLDTSVAGEGLLSPNTRVTDKPYTVLEHAWDEAFGYFGAGRAYASRTDAENAETRAFDHDDSGSVDLQAEYNFPLAVYAVERDLSANAGAPTDFSGRIGGALLAGRALIAGAAEGEALSALDQTMLEAHRDELVRAWEEAIAATVVHYLNETLASMAAVGTEAYDFEGHAEHWSEAKGFALGFQFNPRSPLTREQFLELNTLLGTAPVLPNASEKARLAYADDLRAARTLLGTVYGFSPLNLGDADGAGGW